MHQVLAFGDEDLSMLEEKYGHLVKKDKSKHNNLKNSK